MAAPEAARALIAAEIQGDISQTAYTDEHCLRLASGLLVLKHSPITSVSSVEIDGEPVDASEYEHGFFFLQRKKKLWPYGAEIAVSYETGWAAGGEPSDIAEALSLLEAWFLTNPEQGLSAVQIGEVSAQRGLALYQIVPEVLVKAIVRKYARPRV